MAIDEIEALKAALDVTPANKWPLRPAFWISLDAGEWHVHIEHECLIRIDQAGGQIVREPSWLDPPTAMSIARAYATEHSLTWKPSFSLQLESDHWIVGSCQSQLGGQTSIKVSHQGLVLSHFVNPR